MFDVDVVTMGMICLPIPLSIGMVIYLLACALRFLYILIVKRRITRFTIIPVTVGMFLILIPLLLPYFWDQWRETSPPLPYFPDTSHITSRSLSNEEITSLAIWEATIAAITAALFVGLPIDLILIHIKRKRQSIISSTT